MTRKIVAAFAALLVSATIAVAQPGASSGTRSAALEREARTIDAMLVAPCCFSQQVSVHQSAAADQVRVDVRERLEDGQSREQIIAVYVGRYGKRILAEPPAPGFDLTLYATPIVLFIATITIVALVLRRFASHAPEGATAERFAATADEDARLDDELRDLD